MGNNLRLSGIILIVLFLLIGCSQQHSTEQVEKEPGSAISDDRGVITKTYIYGNNDLLAEIVTHGNSSEITYVIP